MKTIKVKGLPTIEMVEVKGGVFHYGPEIGKVKLEDTYPGELDPEMSINDFCIGKTQVTEELWDAVMGNGYNHSQLPMRNVSWNDCQAFIAKLNEKSECKFRLAYEPEWEYAARGGNMSKGYLYSGSDDANEVAVFSTDSKKLTSPYNVAGLKANELGIYDMSGNVWEWCENWFENHMGARQYYIHAFKSQIIAKLDVMYKSEKDSNKKASIGYAIELVKNDSAWNGQKDFKSYRGGGFDTNMKCSRPYTYVFGKVDYTRPSLGLRLAMDTDSVTEPKHEHIVDFVKKLIDELLKHPEAVSYKPNGIIDPNGGQTPITTDEERKNKEEELTKAIQDANAEWRLINNDEIRNVIKSACEKAKKTLDKADSTIEDLEKAIDSINKCCDKKLEDVIGEITNSNIPNVEQKRKDANNIKINGTLKDKVHTLLDLIEALQNS